MRLQNAFKNSVFEAPKLVSAKTPLLKEQYRRQRSMFDFLSSFFSADQEGHSSIFLKTLVMQ